MYFNNVLDLIGNTPLICLNETTGYNIFAKAEFLNPGGSIKDRIAKNMLDTAEAQGKLRPGMTIIEPTSGNTGIGLALVGVRKGYNVIIVMPENMSEERKKVIQALGAKLILTEPKLSIGGAVDKVGGKYLVDNSVLVVLVELFKSVYEETEGGEYEDTVSTALLHLCGNIEHGIARRDHIVNEDKVHTGNVLTEEFVSSDGVSAVDDGRIVTSLVEHTEIET